MVKTGGNIQLKGGCYPVALYIDTYSVIRMFASLLVPPPTSPSPRGPPSNHREEILKPTNGPELPPPPPPCCAQTDRRLGGSPREEGEVGGEGHFPRQKSFGAKLSWKIPCTTLYTLFLYGYSIIPLCVYSTPL